MNIVCRGLQGLAVLLLAGASMVQAAEVADVVFTNGKVLTVDDRFTVTQAVAVKGERIMAAGSNAEIAKLAGAQTRTPIVVDACRRVDDRPPQASLPWRERAKNIRGAFIYNADLSGKKIAVVDDVMTSRCCARVRRKCRGCRRPLR